MSMSYSSYSTPYQNNIFAPIRTRNPDDPLVVVFKNIPYKNELKSQLAGRDIFDDQEICEIRAPGSKDIKHFPATAVSDWVIDPFTGGQTKRTYAERFRQQYQQFKAQDTQTKSGTPIDVLKGLTEARKAELRALNVYTLEQLAHIDGNELKNLGPAGRDWKNMAQDYIDQGLARVPDIQAAAKIEAQEARLMAQDEELKALKAQLAAQKIEDPDGRFERMSDEQLKDFIAAHNNGIRPIGRLPRRQLLLQAADIKGVRPPLEP